MWIFQGIGSAFSDSLYSAAAKGAVEDWPDELIAWWSRLATALIVFAFALCWHGVPTDFPTGVNFWIPAVISIGLNRSVALAFVRAHRDKLSGTMPLLALSPILMLGTEPLITHRAAPMFGMVGVGIIAIGLYLVNLPAVRQDGLFGPFKKVWDIPAQRLIFLFVVVGGITSPCDKLALRAIDPLWYSMTLHGSVALLLIPAVISRSRKDNVSLRRSWGLSTLGAFAATASMLYMTAIKVAPVTQVMALRRCTPAFSTAWGILRFKEKADPARLIGTLLMIGGSAGILLSL